VASRGVSLLSIDGISLSPASWPVNPSAKLALSASVTSASPAQLSLTWRLAAGPWLNLSDPALVGTSLRGATLGLRAGALAPGASYTFELSASDASDVAVATVSVTAAAAPAGGVLRVSPDAGDALATPFTLDTTGWRDANDAAAAALPLRFQFRYTALDDASGLPRGDAVLLSDFGDAATLVTTALPPGRLLLGALAVNARGVVSSAPANVTLTVRALPSFADAGAQADFLDGVAAGAAGLPPAAAAALLQSAAAALASGPLAGNATAVAAAAERLLGAAAGAAAAAASPAALQAVAAAAASALSACDPAHASAAGAAAALSLFAGIAGTDGRALDVTPAAAAAVASGLSAIAAAALSPGSPVSAALLAQVAAVADTLADSQFAQLRVPGEPPLTVTSAAIQMSLALDSPGPGSRLFAETLTAPGAPACFAPLPADALAGAAELMGGVRTHFVSFAFDVHLSADATNASSATTAFPGVTRLALSTATGGPVEVANLSTPIRFSLPALPADALALSSDAAALPQASARCQFWDAAALRYATAGCAALPDPRPPGHTLAFVDAFAARSNAAMALSWDIAGPLVDGGDCQVTLLDCADAADAARLVFPDAARPLDAPAVRCPPRSASDDASDDPPPALRVYGGARCALWRADNALGCSWSNERQAFVGSGCVASGEPVQCACRHVRSCPCMLCPLSLAHTLPRENKA
jgi:hypothetical protein